MILFLWFSNTVQICEIPQVFCLLLTTFAKCNKSANTDDWQSTVAYWRFFCHLFPEGVKVSKIVCRLLTHCTPKYRQMFIRNPHHPTVVVSSIGYCQNPVSWDCLHMTTHIVMCAVTTCAFVSTHDHHHHLKEHQFFDSLGKWASVGFFFFKPQQQ